MIVVVHLYPILVSGTQFLKIFGFLKMYRKGFRVLVGFLGFVFANVSLLRKIVV